MGSREKPLKGHDTFVSSPVSFGVIAEWVETLHGLGDCEQAIERLLKLVKGDAAFLVRFSKETNHAKTISFVDPEARNLFAIERQCFAKQVFGADLMQSRSGSLWVMRSTNDEDWADMSGELREQIRAQQIHSVAVICLVNAALGMDILEIQFGTAIPDHDRVFLTMISDTLAKTWQQRAPGTAHRQLARNRQMRTQDTLRAAAHSIVRIDNPYGLSRSEFRICLMIQDGLLLKDVIKELVIQQSTARSHLHSIYEKTGSVSLLDLSNKLHLGYSGGRPPAPPVDETLAGLGIAKQGR